MVQIQFLNKYMRHKNTVNSQINNSEHDKNHEEDIDNIRLGEEGRMTLS